MSQCYWNDVNRYWNVFDQLWNDVIPCILHLEGVIAEGCPVEPAYVQAVKKDKELHCKIVKLIMILKNEEITQEKEVCLDKYKVTANDIKLLINEYHRRLESISISVDDILIG